METCQEKIISLELQDPLAAVLPLTDDDDEDEENDDEDGLKHQQQRPEEEEEEAASSSIITVRSNHSHPDHQHIGNNGTTNNQLPGHPSWDEGDNHRRHRTTHESPGSSLSNQEVAPTCSSVSTFISSHPKHNTNSSYSTSTCSTTNEQVPGMGSTTTTTTSTTTLTTLQTIVEVVNPVIAGHGIAHSISIGRLADDGSYPSMDDYPSNLAHDDDDDHEQEEFESHEEQCASASDDEFIYYEQHSDQHELSLNDKMKNVLQELLTNERVQLSWSRSVTEDDAKVVDSDTEDNDEVDTAQNNGNPIDRSVSRMHHYDREDDNQFDSNRNFGHLEAECQVYQNPGADANFQAEQYTPSEQLSAADAELKTRLLSELEVIDAPQHLDRVDIESHQQVLDVKGTADSSGNRSTNGKKKKKNKGKNKKK